MARDAQEWRAFYEEQGERVRNNGEIIHCSSTAVVDVVTRMALEHSGEFQSIVDVGCGANLLYDERLARIGKDVVGIDFTFSFLKISRMSSEALLHNRENG